jgi:hypothetical protein
VYFTVKSYGEDNITSGFLVIALLCVTILLGIRGGGGDIRIRGKKV